MHVNTSQAANPVSDIPTKGYDYLEMAEVMDDKKPIPTRMDSPAIALRYFFK